MPGAIMYRKIPLVVLSCMVVCLSVQVRAELVQGLYSATVAVSDHSEKALAGASREALSQVLVKASGSVEALENTTIRSRLGKSRSYVQQYSYAEDSQGTAALLARFEFDSVVVTRLLTEAGLPLWTANRSAVLVWAVVEGPEGRQFLSWENTPSLAEDLHAAFALRGVPVQLPLYDLADSAALSAQEAWHLSGPVVQAASVRYNAENILVGRAAALTTTGRWMGDWAYLSAQGRIDRSITASDTAEFLRAGVAIAAEEMAARYAVAPSSAQVAGVTMSVRGVETYGDYAGVISWLEGLELIDQANIERISGSEIQLRLTAQADASQLAAIIELNRRLTPVASNIGTASAQLRYQWLK